MRRWVTAFGVLVLLAAPALRAADPSEDERDPLRDAVVRAEQARQNLQDAIEHSRPDDYLRVRRSFDDLEEALTLTPFRGALEDSKRELRAATEGEGGRIPEAAARRLENRVESLARELRKLLVLRLRFPPDPVDSAADDEWRERLDRILEEESLLPGQTETEGLVERSLRRAWEWFHEKFGWLLYLSPEGGGTTIALQLLLSAGLLLLAAFLGHMLLLRVRERKAREAVAEAMPAAVAIDDFENPWEQALAAAGRSEWDAALRRGYQHLVRLLERAGITILGESRTNSEILSDLRQAGKGAGAESAMERANRIFDRVRYGGRAPDGEQWTGFSDSVRIVERGVDPEESQP